MMLQKKKLFIPKQILASKKVLLTKHNDGFAQEIFAKYGVVRNDFAAWFDLFYKIDSTYADYNRTDIGQLLINVRMQLQLQEESSKSSLSILGQQALINFKKQLESTVRTLHSSAGHQSLKYINNGLLKSSIPNSMLFGKEYIREILKNRPRFSYVYDNTTNIQKAINGFNFKSIKPYNAVSGDLNNASSLRINAITGKLGLESVLSHLIQFYINGDRKAINGLTYKSLNQINAFQEILKNELFLNLNTITGKLGLGSVLSHLIQFYINGDRKAINGLNYKSLNPINAFQEVLKNELLLNINTIKTERGLKSVLSHLIQFYINGDRKAINGLTYKSLNQINAFQEVLKNELFLNLNTVKTEHSLGTVHRILKNVLSLKFNTFMGESDLGSALRILTVNGDTKGINSLYLKYIKDNIGTIVNAYGADRLYSNIGNYADNYESIINMNPYSFRNYYRIYFPGLSSYIGSGFKKAYIKGEAIKGFSSIIHDKIASRLRHELPEVLRSAYPLGFLGVHRTKRKQKREMDSEAKEFWHNMTYNIIQGFRKELESKTNYFFTNHIYKGAYGLSPFLEDEDEGEDEEGTKGNWTSQETLIHNKQTYNKHFSQQERGRITPHSINNLRKTYPDIYNMLTFAGLLPTLYMQKHSRETAMGLLSKSIHQYYIGNRNLTVRAYDLLRNKLETEEKGFIWQEAMNNLATMEFGSSRKAHRSTSYMSEIQALKTQVVNIEKQTLQSVQYSNVNINGLVERVYREIEHRIKVDRTRRGY